MCTPCSLTQHTTQMTVCAWMICTWKLLSDTDALPDSWRRQTVRQLVCHSKGKDLQTDPNPGPLRLRKHGQNGNWDCRISPDHLRLDPGFINSAYRLLEGVLCGWDSHHHGDLLVQLVEDVCDRFHRCVQLQGLSFHAGPGWWVSVNSSHLCLLEEKILSSSSFKSEVLDAALLILCGEAYIQVCRGLMISSVCLGFFGAILALIGMKCTKLGGSDATKARLTVLSGFHYILSGNPWMLKVSVY